MKHLAPLVVALFAWFAVPSEADTLKVGGTGSSGPLVELLFDAFRRTAPEARLDLVQPPLGSGGALKALAGGRIDLAIAGRPLKPEEATGCGRHFGFAATPFILATNGGSLPDGLPLATLADIYSGTFTQWADGSPIRLVLRAPFESDTLLLKSLSPAMARGVEAAAARPGMALGQDDLETLRMLTTTPGSLGPTTLGLLTTAGARLTTFGIDNRTPNIAALETGAYPWRKELTVALPKAPLPLAEQFADFLRSEEAQAVLRRNDYLPITQ